MRAQSKKNTSTQHDSELVVVVASPIYVYAIATVVCHFVIV